MWILGDGFKEGDLLGNSWLDSISVQGIKKIKSETLMFISRASVQ